MAAKSVAPRARLPHLDVAGPRRRHRAFRDSDRSPIKEVLGQPSSQQTQEARTFLSSAPRGRRMAEGVRPGRGMASPGRRHAGASGRRHGATSKILWAASLRPVIDFSEWGAHTVDWAVFFLLLIYFFFFYIYIGKEKVYFIPMNYPRSLVFLPKLENRVSHLPQLLKPFILPPLLDYRWFSKAILSFFYLFWLNI